MIFLTKDLKKFDSFIRLYTRIRLPVSCDRSLYGISAPVQFCLPLTLLTYYIYTEPRVVIGKGLWNPGSLRGIG